MKRFGLAVKLLLILSVWPGISGCPSSSGTQAQVVKENEYRKLLDQQKQKAEAKEEQELLKKMPEMKAGDYERLGDTYLKNGDFDFAFIQYNRALNLEPKSIRIRYKMAGLFLTKGLADDAQAGFLSIIEEQPDFAPAYDGMGRVYFIKGDLEKAEASFNKALQLDPQLWQSHNYLGIIKDKQKKYDQAIFQYREAIALRPDIGLLYNNLGMSYLLQGDYEKAVNAFNEALDKGETDPKIINNLALALVKLKRYDDALIVFKLIDTESAAYFKIGNIYLEEKNYAKAEESFEKAIEMNPRYDAKAVQKLKLAKKYLTETGSSKK
jgi:Flp pilus assembly protein TadD